MCDINGTALENLDRSAGSCDGRWIDSILACSGRLRELPWPSRGAMAWRHRPIAGRPPAPFDQQFQVVQGRVKTIIPRGRQSGQILAEAIASLNLYITFNGLLRRTGFGEAPISLIDFAGRQARADGAAASEPLSSTSADSLIAPDETASRSTSDVVAPPSARENSGRRKLLIRSPC